MSSALVAAPNPALRGVNRAGSSVPSGRYCELTTVRLVGLTKGHRVDALIDDGGVEHIEDVEAELQGPAAAHPDVARDRQIDPLVRTAAHVPAARGPSRGECRQLGPWGRLPRRRGPWVLRFGRRDAGKRQRRDRQTHCRNPHAMSRVIRMCRRGFRPASPAIRRQTAAAAADCASSLRWWRRRTRPFSACDVPDRASHPPGTAS